MANRPSLLHPPEYHRKCRLSPASQKNQEKHKKCNMECAVILLLNCANPLQNLYRLLNAML